MGRDDRVAPEREPSQVDGAQQEITGLHRWMKALFDRTPWGKRLNRHAELVRELSRRLAAAETRLDSAEDAQRRVQEELEELRRQRVAQVEERLDASEQQLAEASEETARLRDSVVPAMVGRLDALIERLVSEIDELGSLVERMLRREPLPAPGASPIEEGELAHALARVQPVLLEAFRGSEAEIRHRLDHYLSELRAAPPVLDLGCGRGELLLMLREAGVEAIGVEADAAVATAARRRGLEVIEGEVTQVLRQQPDESFGAVTAIHLFEHLEPSTLMTVVDEARRVLRAGGRLIVECPNPHSLRVGATLYWLDPTHRRPLLPETLELFLKCAGFEVERREMLHPFAEDQRFAVARNVTGSSDDPVVEDVRARLDLLAQQLDELVFGPRDFAVWARKPE
jgi:O-antigen chain-terminating methyltransferase